MNMTRVHKAIALIPRSAMIGAILFAIILVFGPFFSESVNWHYFMDASRAMFTGRSPYDIEGFYNPPWVLIPLAPIALLPEGMGALTIIIIALIVYLYSVLRLGASRAATYAFMLSPPVLLDIPNNNINWMIPLGLFLPRSIGLFLVLAKPQLGAPLALFWFVESWRSGGISQVARDFSPVTIALLFSFGLYGIWPLHMISIVPESRNMSLWPYLIPLGLLLLALALRNRSKKVALSASPFLTPYITFASLSVPLLALASHKRLMIGASICLWLFVAAKFLI